MTYYTYPISIEKEDGQYYAYSEDLPGVYGLGDSIEEAKASMLEGIRLYILECKKDGRPIPAARTIYSETVSVAIE
jgi:predicted RNase H-like HicB family nuclease